MTKTLIKRLISVILCGYYREPSTHTDGNEAGAFGEGATDVEKVFESGAWHVTGDTKQQQSQIYEH